MSEDRTLLPGDEALPSMIGRLEPPLARLRVRGALPSLARAVAIVGTRAADEEAIDFTEHLAGDLAREGCVVVSGGALGIDAAAHRGALDAGGVTVAVLASGFSPAYPPENRGLFARIERTGALVSEVDDGTPPHAGRFLSRNRIIAALGQAVVVVQAPVRSGALSTAAFARKLEVPVFAVPSAPWEARGGGSLALLGQGARVCTSARDVLSLPPPRPPELALEPGGKRDNAQNLADLGADEQRILSVIRVRARHPDEIARRTGLSAPAVQRALLQMVLLGVAEPREGGRFARPRDRLGV